MKRAITWFLIVFIVVAVVTKIVLLNVPQEPPFIPDGNHIVLCHARARCPVCVKMEVLIKKVLEKPEYDGIGLVSLEYDMPKNREFVERFRVGTLAIILLEQESGKTVRSRDISVEAKRRIGNSEDFVEMLKETLNDFHGQTRH